ncbi:hypothetical protein OEZ85_012512 [Tetradesmus obliquus]|uniref:Protein kinase domain-containing protein n=1 Tax=Tetradesmus obliquus TaxID=3088 RepID=A0ABY8TTZ3_TETOB|nr:hypothetical protein OEZ85_012512 [Tetradesmus obliquus]
MAQHPIQADKHQPGIYYVDGQQWSVGTRYTLLKQLGSGSFSSVVSAKDNDTQELVALKRIPDVLLNSENAKRVLREVCILRRLEHPHIIGLKDVFLKPSSTGRYMYRKGALVPTSLDLYLALEFCDQGDLYHMRGQLSESEVRAIMLQLLTAVQYLHRNGVWHRDIKSANILMTYTNGVRHVKLADLGSASDSFCAEAGNASPSEIYARPVAGGGGGFKAPLTRMVCTPCYRAPEVVMSRGGYTKAIDMWGCGCVLGELLQRVAWIGKATTPQLQVGPVFAIHGMPVTPVEGEHFAGPGNSVTRTELSALFAVIGTPSWRCIEGVDNPAWRRYLRKMPPRAPSLFRRFGSAGEVAVDLLARLLSFDPARRCSCEEAMAHEYFEDLLPAMTASGAAAVAAAAAAADAAQQLLDASMDCDDSKPRPPAAADMRPVSILKRARSVSGDSPMGSAITAAAGEGSFAVTRSGQHYYELDDPAAALAALEHDMAALMMSLDKPADVAPGGPTPQAPQPLRELLEREVADHKGHLERRRAAAAASYSDSPGSRSPVKPMSPLLLGASAKRIGPGGLTGVGSNGSIARQWQHLQPDPGPSVDASKIGMQRVPHHADAEQARLEPEQHLRAGRHGEWMPDTLQAGTRRGDVWGVSLVPSGYSEEAHPELAAIIRSQHKR